MKQFERLREVRLERGFRTGTDAAKAMDVSVATYNAHENGHRGLTVKAAERYAQFFNVRPSWLLTGELPKNYMSVDEIESFDWDQGKERHGRFVPGRQYLGHFGNAIPEIDPFESEPEDPPGSHGVVAEWGLPTDFIEQTLRSAGGDICLLAVPDDIMSDLAKAGDRVIVDMAQTELRGSGYYVLRGRDGQLHIRRITKLVVPESDGRDIHLSTDTPPEGTLTSIDRLKIMGKVIGRVSAV